MTHVHREQVPPTVDALIFNELHDAWAATRSFDDPAPWEPVSYLYSDRAFRRLDPDQGSEWAEWPRSVREREQQLMEAGLR